MLESDIQTKIDQANIAVSQDNQKKAQDQVQLLTDQETEDIWMGVNAQATNAISQVNGT
jgi:ribosome recycling factor